ncbi:hypothetical protein ECBCE007MS11_5376 [Escherichia coli BCE007_MS-11]|nr:hypothetical protein ECBCE007MS11_5376 [Escherichia coli BCE007_MS-11]ENA87657.1 hypothetical protein EC2730450_5200 [Escherichia coli 2730450]ESS89257.1 hypothetical protein L343_4309 [Escherichia coli CE549]
MQVITVNTGHTCFVTKFFKVKVTQQKVDKFFVISMKIFNP